MSFIAPLLHVLLRVLNYFRVRIHARLVKYITRLFKYITRFTKIHALLVKYITRFIKLHARLLKHIAHLLKHIAHLLITCSITFFQTQVFKTFTYCLQTKCTGQQDQMNWLT